MTIFKWFLVIFWLFISFSFRAVATESDNIGRKINIACLPHKTFITQKNHPKVTLLNAIELRSTDEKLGGISGLVMLPKKQKAYLISDRAVLMMVDLIINKETQAINCIKNVAIRPLRGRSTNALGGHYGDSEGISFDAERKDILVSFERKHRVVTYNPLSKKLLPKIDYKPLDKKNLPYNESYESVLALKDGSIIAFPERHELQDKALRGFHLMKDKKVLKNIHLKRRGSFWLTDLAVLSNGDFITLERSFSIFSGMAMQMRHIKHKDFLSGGVADGDIIFSMQTGDGVDNFEALDIVPQEDGTYLMYVASDNNFISLQKTLLLSLKYKPEHTPRLKDE